MTKQQFNLMEAYTEIKKANPKLSNDKIMELVNAQYEESMKKAPKEGGKREAHKEAFATFKPQALDMLSKQHKTHLTPKKEGDPQPLFSDLKYLDPSTNTTINGLNALLSYYSDNIDKATYALKCALYVCETDESPYHIIHPVYCNLAVKYVEALNIKDSDEFNDFLKTTSTVVEKGKKEAPIE